MARFSLRLIVSPKDLNPPPPFEILLPDFSETFHTYRHICLPQYHRGWVAHNFFLAIWHCNFQEGCKNRMFFVSVTLNTHKKIPLGQDFDRLYLYLLATKKWSGLEDLSIFSEVTALYAIQPAKINTIGYSRQIKRNWKYEWVVISGSACRKPQKFGRHK